MGTTDYSQYNFKKLEQLLQEIKDALARHHELMMHNFQLLDALSDSE